jgi:hypothetical protein
MIPRRQLQAQTTMAGHLRQTRQDFLERHRATLLRLELTDLTLKTSEIEDDASWSMTGRYLYGWSGYSHETSLAEEHADVRS